jgi:hypothetical protein
MQVVSAMLGASFTLNWHMGWPDHWSGSCRHHGSVRLCRQKITDSSNRLFPPLVVLWAWIGQVLDPDHSCRKALARINAHLAGLGRTTLSTDTGGYCKARKRLPEGLFSRLCRRVGRTLCGKVPPKELWHGRVVKVVDGSASSMPDTPANQKIYPQPSSQKPGCGFPVVSYVAVFCLATGAALDLALGEWFLHDLALFYFLRPLFCAGNIMLADRAFCTYAELALMHFRGVDVVVRIHQTRAVDFRRGRVLGVLDHIVSWNRPGQCPRGLRKSDYLRLPLSLRIREMRYQVQVKGFRTQQLTLATTLLDARLYPAEDLAELYFKRWHVELNFAHIKTTMQMDVLRGKTPQIVRKEIWTHLLAYNLIRTLMWEAASTHNVPSDRISFKGAIQQTTAIAALFAAPIGTCAPIPFHVLLELIAHKLVPHRPHRVEPRVRKRRPKAFPLMTKPRTELKAALGA